MITVPWNLTCIRIPQTRNIFPKIDQVGADSLCERTQAAIEDEVGYFYGSVYKHNKMPSGYGVFVTDNWIHCGKVEVDSFASGRKVSVGITSNILKLVNS